MNPPKPKRLKTGPNTSRRSPFTVYPYLPDNVVDKILSFLPIKLAAQASTVSKQWSQIWPSFPVLDFAEDDDDEPSDSDRHERFFRILKGSFRRCYMHDQKLVEKLRLHFRYQEDEMEEELVSGCITFAIERGLQELEVYSVIKDDDDDDEDKDKDKVEVEEENDEDDEDEMSESNEYKPPPIYFVPSESVFTSESLTSLNLVNLGLYFPDLVSLPSLKTMVLEMVQVYAVKGEEAEPVFPRLIQGCPKIETLHVYQCDLGYSRDLGVDISSTSLKSLHFVDCESLEFYVTAPNLETFLYQSDTDCNSLTLWSSDSLKWLEISSEGLKELGLYGCEKGMDSAISVPNLESFAYSGVVQAKVHFENPPSNLHVTSVKIINYWWTFEYYGFLRDFLQQFHWSNEVLIVIRDAEGLIIPEHCRVEWSPPLPSIKRLQILFSVPLGDRDYWLRPSLTWIAPSAEILPYEYWIDPQSKVHAAPGGGSSSGLVDQLETEA